MNDSPRGKRGASDLRSDLHGHVTAFVADEDRRWFEEHPGVRVRHRPAVPHEWCDPTAVPGCVPVFGPPPFPAGVEATLMVEVQWLAPGARTRHPYYVLGAAA